MPLWLENPLEHPGISWDPSVSKGGLSNKPPPLQRLGGTNYAAVSLVGTLYPSKGWMPQQHSSALSISLRSIQYMLYSALLIFEVDMISVWCWSNQPLQPRLLLYNRAERLCFVLFVSFKHNEHTYLSSWKTGVTLNSETLACCHLRKFRLELLVSTFQHRLESAISFCLSASMEKQKTLDWTWNAHNRALSC